MNFGIQRFSKFYVHVFEVICCTFVICGKGLTLSLIQHFCSRQLWKILHKISNISLNESKIIEKTTSYFSFCHYVFNIHQLQRLQKVSICWKGLNKVLLLYYNYMSMASFVNVMLFMYWFESVWINEFKHIYAVFNHSSCKSHGF